MGRTSTKWVNISFDSFINSTVKTQKFKMHGYALKRIRTLGRSFKGGMKFFVKHSGFINHLRCEVGEICPCWKS